MSKARAVTMLLTCENCETIFRVESSQLQAAGQKVRCSVCRHVWAPEIVDEAPSEAPSLRDSLTILRWPVMICATLAVLVSLIIVNRGLITSYMPSTIAAFELSGFMITPDLNKLEVRALKATYGGDTLRITGKLANQSSLRTHAAPLQVTIYDDAGVVMHSQRLQPDDYFINGQDSTAFFIQVTIEDTDQAEISVMPLAIRLGSDAS